MGSQTVRHNWATFTFTFSTHYFVTSVSNTFIHSPLHDHPHHIPGTFPGGPTTAFPSSLTPNRLVFYLQGKVQEHYWDKSLGHTGSRTQLWLGLGLWPRTQREVHAPCLKSWVGEVAPCLGTAFAQDVSLDSGMSLGGQPQPGFSHLWPGWRQWGAAPASAASS